MSEDLVIEIAAKLIDAINNISKEENILNTWAPPIAVIIASIITFYAMLRQANKTYQGMVEQTNKTYQGMVEQTNKTIEHSDFLFLLKKKEEIYIYLNIITKEIRNKNHIITQSYEDINAMTSESITLIVEEKERVKIEQETIHKINMVVSIYLQELHENREKLNNAYNEYNRLYSIGTYRILNGGIPFKKNGLSELSKYSKIIVDLVDDMQKETINITR